MVRSTRARRYKSRSKSIPKKTSKNNDDDDALRTPRPKQNSSSRAKTPKRSVKRKRERADTADIIIQDINENLRQEQMEQATHVNNNTIISSDLSSNVVF